MMGGARGVPTAGAELLPLSSLCCHTSAVPVRTVWLAIKMDKHTRTPDNQSCAWASTVREHFAKHERCDGPTMWGRHHCSNGQGHASEHTCGVWKG